MVFERNELGRKSNRKRQHLLILFIELLIFNLEVDGDIFLCGQLDQDVGVKGLALANGGIEGYDYQGVRGVGFGQQKDADYAVILHSVVLRL